MDRIEIVDRLVERCKVLVEDTVDDQGLASMAEVSLGILGKFRGVAQEILHGWVTLRAQALTTEQPKCPACENGGEPELVHTRTVHPTTLFGPIEVPVRTFRCPSGHRHFRPDDRVLGVPVTGDFTDDVRVLFAPLVAELPHRLAADLFRQLTGVDLSSCGAQSIIESVATEVGAWREKREDEGRSSPDPDPTGQAEDRGLEVSMDGVMVHVDGAWREAKVATIQVRQREEPDGPEPVLGSSPAKRLACTLGKPRDLARKILKTIREAGREKLPVWEILGDGAPWIWKLAEKHFPGAPQRLDWYHLREHCFAFANEQYRSEVLAAGWVDGVMDRLLKDDVTAGLNSIRALDPRTRAARKAKNGLLGYLETNRVRIAYQEAWTSGLATARLPWREEGGSISFSRASSEPACGGPPPGSSRCWRADSPGSTKTSIPSGPNVFREGWPHDLQFKGAPARVQAHVDGLPADHAFGWRMSRGSGPSPFPVPSAESALALRGSTSRPTTALTQGARMEESIMRVVCGLIAVALTLGWAPGCVPGDSGSGFPKIEFDLDRTAVRILQGRWRPGIAGHSPGWEDGKRGLPFFNSADLALVSGLGDDQWSGFPAGLMARFNRGSGGFRIGDHEFYIVTIEETGKGRTDWAFIVSPGPSGLGRGVGGLVFGSGWRAVKGRGTIRKSALQEMGFNLVFEGTPEEEDIALRAGLADPGWTSDFSPGH